MDFGHVRRFRARSEQLGYGIARYPGDSAAKGRYIETVVKIGYRFIAPVDLVESPSATVTEATRPAVAATAEIEVEAATKPPSNSDPRRQMWRWGIGLAAVIALAAGLAYVQFTRSRERRGTAARRITLAVLPFENLTGDAGQDYFSDGLTEEMIAQLGRLDPNRISVIARASVMHYKNKPVQLPQIAQDLGAQYVLEGSVRRDSDRVRINAQLVQLKDQVPLWSRQYDRQLSNILTLQAEIAYEVGDEIQMILGDGGATKQRAAFVAPTTSYEAYEGQPRSGNTGAPSNSIPITPPPTSGMQSVWVFRDVSTRRLPRASAPASLIPCR